MLSWLLNQRVASVEEFWTSLLSDDELVAAQVLLPECTSVIRAAVFMKAMTIDAGQAALNRALSVHWAVVAEMAQFNRAFELAARFQHKKAYDMQYLAVAELTNSTLITRDRGLRHAATQVGVPVRFLG